MALFFIIVAFLLGVPLYLDYKKDPKNNIITRSINEVSSNPSVANILVRIRPHTDRYGIHPLLVLMGGGLLLLFIIILIL